MTFEILKLIADENNITAITRTLLNDMLTCSKELLEDMTPSVCNIIEMNAPTKIWYFDSMLRILVIAGNYVDEESINSVLNIVTNTPQLQAYALYKLYLAACDNQNQEGLIKTIFWLLGEYYGRFPSYLAILFSGVDPVSGQKLPKISEESVVSMIVSFSKASKSTIVKQTGMNALMKMESKLRDRRLRDEIKGYIGEMKYSENYECQTRASEYSNLLEEQWAEWKEEIFKPMPAPDPSFVTVSEYPISHLGSSSAQ